MDSHDADLPDHPEDPFPPEEGKGVVPPAVDEDAEDFVDDENEEDDEATLDEEEGLLEDDDDELDDLEAEADMDIEELRKKYGYGAPAPADDEDAPCVSSAGVEAQAEEEMEVVTGEALETAANDYFGVAENNEAEEEDVDYEPPEKKEFQIRVDPLLYQAEVPEGTEGADATAEHAQGTLLWSPREDVTSEALNRFVHEWKARRHGVQTDETKIDSRDDEDALFALLSSAYSTVAAAEAFPGTPANQCERTIDGATKDFSAEEKLAFETGFKDNYKNFRVIRESFVPSRSLGELINYYYNWKKTPRFSEFRRTLQRKDFMTEVMDQMEGSKRRREAAAAAEKTIAESTASSTTVVPSENDEDEVEYEDPLAGSANDLPADVWAAPPPPQHEQPTESA